jgi:chromate transporter
MPDDVAEAQSQSEHAPPFSRGARLREIATLFFRLGAVSFGGPAVQVALMEDEVVRRRNWLDRQHLLDLYSAMNVIPGPNSTELALALGLVRAGFAGLVVAGFSFILPAVLIILVMAWAYTRYGTVPEIRPVLSSMNAAVIAILAATFWRLTTAAVRDVFTGIVFAGALAASIALRAHPRFQPELLILAVSALSGALWYGRPRLNTATLPLLAVIAPTTELNRAPMSRLFLAFLKIGATLYGSGYVLVSYLRTTVVEQHHWINHQELLDGIAVGQITPGPVLTTATFVGYVVGNRSLGGLAGGVLGAVVATVGIFLPSFCLVSILGHVLGKTRTNRYVRGALDGMNAAVAALILIVTLQLAVATFGMPRPSAGPTFGLDPILIAVTVIAATTLLVFDLNATWSIAAAALVGVVRATL